MCRRSSFYEVFSPGLLVTHLLLCLLTRLRVVVARWTINMNQHEWIKVLFCKVDNQQGPSGGGSTTCSSLLGIRIEILPWMNKSFIMQGALLAIEIEILPGMNKSNANQQYLFHCLNIGLGWRGKARWTSSSGRRGSNTTLLEALWTLGSARLLC